VNNTTYILLHCFQIIVDYWSNFHFQQGEYFFLTHLFGVNLKLTTTKFGVGKLETSPYCMVWKVFWYLESFRCGSRVWQTNGQLGRWPL